MADPVVQGAALLLPQIVPEFGQGERTSLRLSAADQLLEHHFRQQRSGSLERQAISELVYYILRHRRSLEAVVRHLLPESGQPEPLFLAQAASVALREGWQQLGGWQRLARLLGIEPLPGSVPLLPLSDAEQHELPEWLWQQWLTEWGREQTSALAKALNQPATVDLRVNTLRANREQVLAELTAHRLSCQYTPHAPHGLRLHERQALQPLAAFQQGWFEVQDEGSQLMAPLLQPRPGELIIDLCAGGGGKTLHLAALLNNRGRLVAVDNEAGRLLRLTQRCKRAGVRIVRTVPVRHERDTPLKEWENKADAVLVDVPCSGSGTLRRHPELKWRLQSAQIAAYHYRQCALLEAGARLTRPGGRLLYVTCSLLARENQDVVAAFLADNRSFRSKMAVLPPGLTAEGPLFHLLPHRSGTDGFFAALLQRLA
ncbi:MAG: RsmB/NOP family class I SAM-dependent RNA methyltransferase [Magnetococcales bacterium]|nr:RsmB/NOP family class I SAM-dependent RNA methyltransferase [Magnetococcales bacterium]